MAVPTFEKLDRILVTIEWEEKCSLTTVQALTRGLSNDNPLLLNSEEPSSTCTQPFCLNLKCGDSRNLLKILSILDIHLNQSMRKLIVKL
jgi:hypothetical protein